MISWQVTLNLDYGDDCDGITIDLNFDNYECANSCFISMVDCDNVVSANLWLIIDNDADLVPTSHLVNSICDGVIARNSVQVRDYLTPFMNVINGETNEPNL